MTDRPVVLLDVDGVLNKVGSHYHPDLFGDFQSTACAGFEIQYSLKMGARLAALDADIVWLTTWEEKANEWIGPLFGWPEFPVLRGGAELSRRGWWKSVLAEKFIMKNPRPFVWIDDDLDYAIERGEVDWLADLPGDVRALEHPYMLVSPDVRTGILPAQLDEVENFVESRS